MNTLQKIVLGFLLAAVAAARVFGAAPVITRQPAGASKAEGDHFMLTVLTSAVSMQWYKDGQPVPSTIPGANFNAYDLGRVRPSDAGTYTVTVTNADGSVTSQPAVLTVTPGPYFISQSFPGVIGQPLSVNVSGYGTISYQWYHDGAPVAGATGASHTPAAEGLYRVIVTDALGTLDSGYIRVVPPTRLITWRNGWAAPSSAASVSAPSMKVISQGDPVLCITSGGLVGPVTYGLPQAPLPVVGGEVIYNAASGSSWGYGSVSGVGWIGGTYVSGSPVTEPAIATATRAGNAAIVTHLGTVVAGRSWEHGTSIVYEPNTFPYGGTHVGPTIHFGTLLPLPPLIGVIDVAATDDSFLARHENGTLTQWEASTGTLQVHPAGLAGPIRAIAAGTDHFLALTAGGEVIAWGDNSDGEASVPPGLVNVSQIAAGPDFSLALRMDGTVVAWGSNAAGQTSVPPGLTGVSRISATLGAAFAHHADGSTTLLGTAEAQIPTRGVSHIISAGSIPHPYQSGQRLYVGHASYTAPSIVVQPAPLSLLSEDGFVLRTSVVSMLQPSYQWYRGGSLVGGATSSYFQVNPARPGDTGQYHVVITNAEGSTTSDAAQVQVADAPQFFYQPQSVALSAAGGSVTLETSPWSYSGAAMTYQWYRDGVPVPGADQNFLILPSVQPAQTGLYRLIATNSHGSRSSVAARVGIAGMPAAWKDGGVMSATCSPAATVQALGGGDARFAISTDLRAVTLSTSGMTGGPPQNIASISGSAVDVASRGSRAITLSGNGSVSRWDWNSSYLSSGAKPQNTGTGVAVSMGDSECVLIRADGEVLRWLNTIPTDPASPFMLPVPAAARSALHITSGADHHLALMPGGAVVAFGGANLHGQTDVPAGLTGVIGIAAGDGFSIALKNDGTVVGWGSNASGALTSLPGLANVVKIRAGRGSVLAMHADGSFTIWGQESVAGDVSPIPASLGMLNEAGIFPGHGFALKTITSPILVTEAPHDMKVFYGYTGPSFRVSVSNSPVTYQWLRDGQPLAGATGNVMSLQNAGYYPQGAGWYSCVIGSSEASHTTRPVYLTVITRNDYNTWSWNQLGGSYGPLQTPFGHPIANLLCHALGLDPRRPDMTRLPALCFETNSTSGQQHAGLTFEVPGDLNGVSFVLRSTHDLSLPFSAWSTHAVTPVLGGSSGGRRRVYLMDTQPAGSRCFYRLEVLQSTPSALPEF